MEYDMELIISGKRDIHNHKCSDYRCDCGNIFTARDYSVRIGRTSHCGCKKIKHGLYIKGASKKPMTLFYNIKKRCYDKHNKSYNNYGGRGIVMQDDWINNFEKFNNYVSSLENAYKEGYSLDRKNNNDGYFEGNIKWSTKKEQNNNRRRRRTCTGYDYITIDRKYFKVKLPVGDKKYKLFFTKTLDEAIDIRDICLGQKS